MSKMKTIAALMAMAAMSGQSFMASGHGDELDTFNPVNAPKPMGVQKFIIEGKEVWAINRKNAIRKAAKL